MDPKRTKKLEEFQSKIGYRFKKIEILNESLTHDSLRVGNTALLTYQRLEWLGDAILHTLVSKHLFRQQTNIREGKLSEERAKLVEEKAQSKVANDLNLDNYVEFASSVERNKFKRIDKFVESVIGAIYIDAGNKGEDEVRKFVNKYWQINIEPTNDGWVSWFTKTFF